MEQAHELILLGGALGLASIFTGLLSSRINTPVLLVFLAVGMLAGEDGPGGIRFDDFHSSYLVGSIALTAILFEGGFKTERSALQQALWPALVMATVGVAISAAVVCAAAVLLFGIPVGQALLIGAALAPTDAAAVSSLLRRARVAVPERVMALLEVESGLNDPMSVVLTVGVTTALTVPGGLTVGSAGLMFASEMAGGAAFGIGGGYALLLLLRRLQADAEIFPVLALAWVLAIFGAAQWLGASGFLAVYLVGVIVGTSDYQTRKRLGQFYEAFGWLAQVTLFLLLGLLVTPHKLLPAAGVIAAVAAVLIFVARPLAAGICLLPFGFGLRGTTFAAWVGLRGAVPIYLTIIPVLAGAPGGEQLFGIAFGTVVASLVVQGWTIRQTAGLLGYEREGA